MLSGKRSAMLCELLHRCQWLVARKRIIGIRAHREHAGRSAAGGSEWCTRHTERPACRTCRNGHAQLAPRDKSLRVNRDFEPANNPMSSSEVKFPSFLPMVFSVGCQMPSRLRTAAFLALALFFGTSCAFAQEPNTSDSTTCGKEIPVGVRVVRIPEADQHKLTISDFSISTDHDASTYNLTMQVKNGTDNWCVTSFAIKYLFGDARGQEWTANEYPTVLQFKSGPDSVPRPTKAQKAASSADPIPRNVGIVPGGDEKRTVFNVYNYIESHPSGLFDGFHLITAEIRYSMGYSLTKAK